MPETDNSRQSNKARLKEITDSIEDGIKNLFETEKYKQYLSTMSRFHRYSVNNTMLIYMQRPDATLVAGFNKWKNQFSRSVMKGEKGIRIIAPTPYKKKVEEIKLDPDTKAPVLDKDGIAILEEKEVSIPMFKVVSVFDVSQTQGKPLPQLATNLSGNVEQYEIFMEALRRSSPVPMEIKPIERGSDGFFNLKDQSITIQAGMSEVQTVCAAVHEIAHAKLHNYEKMTELADDGETILAPGEKDRNTEEVEAESISYAVCQYYGIETAENSFGYIATWSQGKELKELRRSLETINKTASELITDIDRHFKDICKERGVDLTAETEQAAPIEEPPTPEPEMPHTQNEVPPMELPLDEYPMPDSTMTMADLESCNYLDGDLLPLSLDEAVRLADKDMTVYAIAGGEAQMVFDRDDIDAQAPGTVFAVSREEWEQSPEFHALVMNRLNHQEQREQAFLSHGGDCFAIYQVKQDDTFAWMRFLSLDGLERTGVGVERNNYDLIYTGSLPENATTESIYEKFNIDRPADYHTHSLSVSDIVAIRRDGALSCHYCDSFGFKEIPGFIQQENPLKNAEMTIEDDLGMIDGVINNGKHPTVAELEQQAHSAPHFSDGFG